MRWVGQVAPKGDMKKRVRILVEKLESKRPFERPRRRWEDIIKMDLREIVYGGVEWIHLAQNVNR
jgi:hypothetical protein